GIVYEDVDVDKIARQLIEDLLRRVRLLQVLGDCSHQRRSCGFQFRRNLLKFRCDWSNEHQWMSMPSEFLREMQSYPAAGARNQGSFCDRCCLRLHDARRRLRWTLHQNIWRRHPSNLPFYESLIADVAAVIAPSFFRR